jgi:hypothetical protein
MARRKKLLPERRILLPWENEGTWRRWVGRLRLRTLVAVLVAVGLLVALGVSERHRAGVRQTRAVVDHASRLVDRYLAEHGRCPADLEEVSRYARLDAVPRDAWGEPLEFRCPAGDASVRYELVSHRLEADNDHPVLKGNL